jgi:hypothetical protein
VPRMGGGGARAANIDIMRLMRFALVPRYIRRIHHWPIWVGGDGGGGGGGTFGGGGGRGTCGGGPGELRVECGAPFGSAPHPTAHATAHATGSNLPS